MPEKITPITAYQGGKQRIAAQLLDIMKPQGRFYDLCCGSGAVSIELVNRGHDPKLITMVDQGPWGLFWEKVGDGTFDLSQLKLYCESIPKDRKLIKGFMEELSKQPADKDTVYVYLLLQASSFGSKAIWIKDNKWCNTTFRNYWEPTETSNRRSHVNPMMPLPDTLYHRAEIVVERMLGVKGMCCDVWDVKPVSGIVYIDPPYEGTTAYGHQLNAGLYAQTQIIQCYVSEGNPLSQIAYPISGGRKKGGISGERAWAHHEWLSLV